MTCKHRYEPTTFGMSGRIPGSYWYCCTRCGNVIWTTLKEQQK
jgi:hypothetical protein